MGLLHFIFKLIGGIFGLIFGLLGGILGLVFGAIGAVIGLVVLLALFGLPILLLVLLL